MYTHEPSTATKLIISTPGLEEPVQSSSRDSKARGCYQDQ